MGLPGNCVLCWVIPEGRELTYRPCSPRCSRVRLEVGFQWADVSACRVKALLLFCSPMASRFICKIHTLQTMAFCSLTCLGLALFFSFLGMCFLPCWDQLSSVIVYGDLAASMGGDGKKWEQVLCDRGCVGVQRGMGITCFEERTFSLAFYCQKLEWFCMKI